MLFKKAGIELYDSKGDRKRKLYGTHSTRVGAACGLLKADLSEKVISMLCGWKSDMIKRYAERVVLKPSEVDAWAFFNPVSLAGSYGGNSSTVGDSAAPAAKRSKVR